MSKKYLISHNDIIRESLKSHNYEHLLKQLKELLSNNIIAIDKNHSTEKKFNNRIVVLQITNKLDIFNNSLHKLNDSKLSHKIYEILNFHNYYISLIEYNQNNNLIYLEPMYTKEATEFIRSNGDILYHITNRKNLNDILKTGLRPKVGKSNDPNKNGYRYFVERVFLIANSKNIKDDIDEVTSNLDENDYVILKIDASKLNFTFWWDDASKGNTVYTYESISPKFISIANNI